MQTPVQKAFRFPQPAPPPRRRAAVRRDSVRNGACLRDSVRQRALSGDAVRRKTYRIGELFCGASGLALGASRASYKNRVLRHVWACDNDKDTSNHERALQHSITTERLKHIKPGENVWTADLPAHLKLNMKSGATISQIYKRLKPDEPSYTITGSGGGGTHVYHWSEPRALTNRERARLQTFPDDFVFQGGKESVRKQIGMAVPPKPAALILQQILKKLYEL